MITEWIRNADPEVILWLVFVILFLVVELITVGLTSIWFAAGAFCSMLIAGFTNITLLPQIVIFLIVSVILLIATRPFAQKFNAHTQRTNVEDLVGEEILVTQRVSNREQTGAAFVRGLEWAVRSQSDDVVIEEGEKAQIQRISGVKLIVKKINN